MSNPPLAAKSAARTAEAADLLGRSGSLAEAILDATNLVVYLKDPTGRYLYINSEYERVANVPRQLVVGKYDTDFFSPEVAHLFREQDLEVMRRRTMVEFEETIPLPGGTLSFLTAKFPLIDERGEIYAVGGACTDVTSRLKASDDTLVSARERLAVTLRSISEGVISTDTQGLIVQLNPTAENLTGFRQGEASGRPVEEIFRVLPAAPGQQPSQPLRAALALGDRVRAPGDLTLETCGGEQRLVTASAAPVRDRAGLIIGAVLSFRDVTDDRRAAEELFKAKRLESIGVLAGGLAHDFNNLLEGILGNVSLAKEQLAPDDPARRQLQAAEKASVRARGLVRQLLTFSAGGQPQRERTALPELVCDAANFALFGSDTSCHFDFPDDLWAAEVDRIQLTQVVQNLVLNARQAQADGGAVRLRAENLLAADPPAPGLSPGRYLRLVVDDDGPGIAPENLDRIFDPYFTTRAEGSGLGLPVAFSVVARHGGHLSVHSPPGAGAQFSVLLPAADGAAPSATAARPADSLGGFKRILVMEDDEDNRDLLGLMLRRMGVEVILTREGREATAAYREAFYTGRPVDLVLLDLRVSGLGMPGDQAARQILSLDPKARLVVSSGSTDHPCVRSPKEHGFAAAAVKPYTFEELKAVLASALA